MTPKTGFIANSFGILGSLFLLSCAHTDAEKHTAERPTKPYRVIFNYDTSGVIGQGHGVIGSATTTEEYMQYCYGHAIFSDDSQVDAVFWHDGAGGNTANWDSQVTGKDRGANRQSFPSPA